MSKPRNSLERMAAEAAARLDKARAAGEQLQLLPDEPGRTPAEVASGAEGKGGRPKGALGKGSSQMRDWLAAKGYRMPEDVLAEMAALASTDGAMMAAMASAEQILAWAFDGAKDKDGNPRTPTAEQRLAQFQTQYAIQLRAADALLPYGTPKASPDVNVQQAVTFVMPDAGRDPASTARDVTPDQRPMPSGLVPADVAHEMQQNQQVNRSAPHDPDAKTRTGQENE